MKRVWHQAFLLFALAADIWGGCSSSIGKASINELEVTGGTNFLEVVHLDPSVNTTGWKVYLCRSSNSCTTYNFSSVSGVSDPDTGRTYYLFDIGSSGKLNDFQAVLLDGANNTVDFINATGQAVYSRFATSGYSTNCAFPYQTTVSPAPDPADKLLYRGPDGTGDWAIIDKNGNASDFDTPRATNNDNPACTIPDYHLTKSVNDPVPFVGEGVTFTITVKNNGCRPMQNAALADSVPASYLSTASPTSWSVPPLSYGQSQTFYLPATVTGGAGMTVSNTATVSIASENSNTLTDNTASVQLFPIAPLAEYRFDNCTWNTPDTFRDETGNYSGTAKNLIADSGQVCKGGNFTTDGTDDVVQLPHTFLSDKGNFSYSMWVKTPNTGGRQQLLDGVDIGLLSLHNEVEIYLNGNNLLGVSIKDTTKTFTLSANEITDNTWKHITITRNGENVCLYINGNLKQCQAGFPTGNLSIDMNRLLIGQKQKIFLISLLYYIDANSGFNGVMDEITAFNGALNAEQVQRIYSYQSTGERNYNGSFRTCDPCGTTPKCTEFAYDLYHTADPYRLQTRIASRPFDVNVTVACTGTGAIPSRKIAKVYGFTGSCPADTAGFPLLWSGAADINDTVRTVTLGGLASPGAYSNIGLMLETDAGEFHCSSDRFAIRPPSFAITSPASPIRAGEITLQVSASDSGGGYDGTATATTALQTSDPDCPVADGFLSSGALSEPLSLPFSGDVHTSELNATDIGEVYLNLKDTSWTAVDQSGDCIPESNATIADALGRFGCNIDSNLSLKIVPHHFDVNATLSDFAGGSYTYLSRDLAMAADLDIKVTAKSAEGITTRNYTKGCYAKNATLTLSHTAIPAPLTQILYDFGGAEENITKSSDIVLSIQEPVFAEGVAPLQLRLNFDRDPARPLSPFDFSLETAQVADADAVTNTDGITELTGSATYVYGRVRSYDIATDEPAAPNPVEFEVYSTIPGGFVSGMPQSVLKWYRNTDHDTAAEGNVIRGGFSPGADEIDVSPSPSDGLQVVTVTSSADRTVHLDIAPWLWYSPTNGYDYGGDCASHPCFRYDYTGTASGVTGVSSGTFRGSDFEMKPAKNITNKGVKLFR